MTPDIIAGIENEQENFDYTKWQREYFDNKDDTELFEEIKSFCDRYHYKGNATIL